MEMFMQVFYAPGIWEFMTLDDENCQKHYEIPFTFRDHATKSMETYADRVPMGVGIMRVIPIESSVDATSKILDSESASKLIMANKDSIAILPCQCRRVRRYTNEGAGDRHVHVLQSARTAFYPEWAWSGHYCGRSAGKAQIL